MNFSKKIFAFIKITRPINVAITFFVVVVAILISKNTELELSKIVLASLAAALVAAAGNIVNDFYDVETDKISHPNRILVMGVITKKEALFEYQFLNLIAVIISAYLSITLLIIVFVSIVLLFFYSYLFKQKPLIGNIIISFLAGMAFIYGGFVSGNPLDAIIPALFASNLGDTIQKDYNETLAQFFDLIVGTSTGAIVGVALANEISHQNIPNIYFEDSKNIFQGSGIGLMSPIHDHNHLKDVMSKHMDNKFNLKLKDCKTHVCVVTNESKGRNAWYLTNTPAIENFNWGTDNFTSEKFIPSGNIGIKKIIRATSAAPTYFIATILYESALKSFNLRKQGIPRILADG